FPSSEFTRVANFQTPTFRNPIAPRLACAHDLLPYSEISPRFAAFPRYFAPPAEFPVSSPTDTHPLPFPLRISPLGHSLFTGLLCPPSSSFGDQAGHLPPPVPKRSPCTRHTDGPGQPCGPRARIA